MPTPDSDVFRVILTDVEQREGPPTHWFESPRGKNPESLLLWNEPSDSAAVDL